MIASVGHWAILIIQTWAGVNETITLAPEQGAQKKRILGRREERNSCFLTEEAQMEAQVLLSTTITAARAVARRWGWRECRPAARTYTDTECTTWTHTSLFRQHWRRVEMRAQPLSQPTRDKLAYYDTHSFTHTYCWKERVISVWKRWEDLPKIGAKCQKRRHQKKTEDCWCDPTHAS